MPLTTEFMHSRCCLVYIQEIFVGTVYHVQRAIKDLGPVVGYRHWVVVEATKMGDTHFTNADITHNLVTFDGGLDAAARLYADGRDLKLLDQSDLMRTEVDVKGSKQVLSVAVLTYVEVAVTAVLQLRNYLRQACRGRR